MQDGRPPPDQAVSRLDGAQAVRDRGDWEAWLAFFLRGIEAVSTEATETARRILELREQHERRAEGTPHEDVADVEGHALSVFVRKRT